MNLVFITYITAATMRLWPMLHSLRRSVDIHSSMFAQYDACTHASTEMSTDTSYQMQRNNPLI